MFQLVDQLTIFLNNSVACAETTHFFGTPRLVIKDRAFGWMAVSRRRQGTLSQVRPSRGSVSKDGSCMESWEQGRKVIIVRVKTGRSQPHVKVGVNQPTPQLPPYSVLPEDNEELPSWDSSPLPSCQTTIALATGQMTLMHIFPEIWGGGHQRAITDSCSPLLESREL